jgi:hypothetical protein
MQGCLLCLLATNSLDVLALTSFLFVYGALLQLAFDSEGIALTSTMGFVKNPVSSSSSRNSSWCTQGASAEAAELAAALHGQEKH